MSECVKEFWGNSSREYRFKQWGKSPIARFDYILTKKMLLRFLKPSNNDSLLEIGCGPGTWTRIVSERCKKLTAVDVSEGMINEAEKYCKNKNICFIRKDFMKLRFNQKFDKIFAVRSIEYVKDKSGLLRKVSSLLKSNGSIVLITKNKPCLWDAMKKEKNFWQDKISPKDLKELCEKIGFSNVVIKPVILRMPIFTNGNREFPIISEKYEQLVLKFFDKIAKIAQSANGMLQEVLLRTAESYLLYAEKV